MKFKQLAVGILSAAVFFSSIPAVPAWANIQQRTTVGSGTDYTYDEETKTYTVNNYKAFMSAIDWRGVDGTNNTPGENIKVVLADNITAATDGWYTGGADAIEGNGSATFADVQDNITLDLNGHSITGSAPTTNGMIHLNNTGSLSITDSSSDSKGKINVSCENCPLILMMTAGGDFSVAEGIEVKNTASQGTNSWTFYGGGNTITNNGTIGSMWIASNSSTEIYNYGTIGGDSVDTIKVDGEASILNHEGGTVSAKIATAKTESRNGKLALAYTGTYTPASIDVAKDTSLDITGEVSFTNSGKITVEGEFETWGEITNSGTIEIVSGGKIKNGGTIINGNAITILDTGELENYGMLKNKGTITSNGRIQNKIEGVYQGVYQYEVVENTDSGTVGGNGKITTIFPGTEFLIKSGATPTINDIAVNTEYGKKWTSAMLTLTGLDPKHPTTNTVGEIAYGVEQITGLVFESESALSKAPEFSDSSVTVGAIGAENSYFATKEDITDLHIAVADGQWQVIDPTYSGYRFKEWTATHGSLDENGSFAFDNGIAEFAASWTANYVPEPEPEPEPTGEPTPTAEPTATPTAEPTATPTAEPTATPTAEPTATPTQAPLPTPEPDPAANLDPTQDPTAGKTASGEAKVTEEAGVKTTEQENTDGSKTTIIEDSNTGKTTTIVEEADKTTTTKTEEVNGSTGYKTETVKTEKENGDFVEKTVETSPTGEATEKTASQTTNKDQSVTTTEGSKAADGTSTALERSTQTTGDFEQKYFEMDATGKVVLAETSSKTTAADGTVTEKVETKDQTGTKETEVKKDATGAVTDISTKETMLAGKTTEATYEPQGTSVAVSNIKSTDSVLVIPATVKSAEAVFPVTEIGEGALEGQSLEAVSIPESVTKVDKNAFKDCGMTELDIEGKVTKNMFAKNSLKNNGTGKKGKGLTITVDSKKDAKALKKQLAKAGAKKAKVVVR